MSSGKRRPTDPEISRELIKTQGDKLLLLTSQNTGNGLTIEVDKALDPPNQGLGVNLTYWENAIMTPSVGEERCFGLPVRVDENPKTEFAEAHTCGH